MRSTPPATPSLPSGRTAGFLDLCFDAKRAAEITLQPIRRFGFDAAILFSDILVVPHALGQRVSFVEGEGPRLDALKGPAALQTLRRAGSPSPLSAQPLISLARKSSCWCK